MHPSAQHQVKSGDSLGELANSCQPIATELLTKAISSLADICFSCSNAIYVSLLFQYLRPWRTKKTKKWKKKSKFLEKKFLYPIIKVNKRKQTDCHIHGAERSWEASNDWFTTASNYFMFLTNIWNLLLLSEQHTSTEDCHLREKWGTGL